MTLEIDLRAVSGNGAVRNLAGKERGIDARRALRLDQADAANEDVRIVVPEYLLAISDSFLLGLLAPSVERAGGLDRFLEKFHFAATDHATVHIMRGLQRAAAPRRSIVSAPN